MKAPIPANEAERLRSLQLYDILDSLPEKSFDEITLLAAHICECPIATVSIIDENRQWYKSRVGIDVTETSRDIAFCAHTIRQDHLLVIPDTTLDERFSDNPVVTDGPKVRFYAGAPLINREGFGLGTLCVVDVQPRQMKKEQIDALEALGRQVVLMLELRRSEREVKELNNALEQRVMDRTAELHSANQSLKVEIEERERIQQQMLQIQKMEAIGRLAGGIAHDFNNILLVITGYCEMLLDEPGVTATDREAVLEIQKAGKRAASLTRQLLTFSRRQVIEPKVLDLNDTVQNVSGMLLRLIGKDVQFDIEKGENLQAIRADENQIEQVIMNLVINACDAMPQGGKLRLETSSLLLEKPLPFEGGEIPPGSYTLLAVQDSGTGMSAEIKAKIYEPFFTTKPIGKGTGLGLATCFGIVQQSGGFIRCDSEIGRGTTFHVFLPTAHTQAKTVRTGRLSMNSQRGRETILLVEDDSAVRRLTALTLRNLGYTVLEAGDGLEAVALVQSRSQLAIDLLVTDVIMPHFNGRELIERLAVLLPEMKCILVSGYTDDVLIHRGVLDAQAAYLQKPFTPAQLSQRVREVLDQGAIAS
jgi:signal transduction histidine kinase/CheY-like chemotaxis protein